MFVSTEQTRQMRNLSQANLRYCKEYVKSCFNEYGGVLDVKIYEPSDNLIKQIEIAQKKIKEVCKSIVFPNSYFLFFYEVVPSSANFATIIIDKKSCHMDADYILLVNKNCCQDIIRDLVFRYGEMFTKIPYGNTIWLVLLDMATMIISGKNSYSNKDKENLRISRALTLEKELIEKGWSVNSIIDEFFSYGINTNRKALKLCFAYYYENEFSNSPGHIRFKNET